MSLAGRCAQGSFLTVVSHWEGRSVVGIEGTADGSSGGSVVSADVFRVLSMSGVNVKKAMFERAREVKGEPGDVAQLVACLPSMQKVPGLIPDTAELSRGVPVPACSESWHLLTQGSKKDSWLLQR